MVRTVRLPQEATEALGRRKDTPEDLRSKGRGAPKDPSSAVLLDMAPRNRYSSPDRLLKFGRDHRP